MDMYEKGEMNALGEIIPSVVCEMVKDAGQRAMDAMITKLAYSHGFTESGDFDFTIGCTFTPKVKAA